MLTPGALLSLTWTDGCMLFAGWEVRTAKTVTEVLKMQAAGLGQHFQDPGSSFAPYKTMISRQITCSFKNTFCQLLQLKHVLKSLEITLFYRKLNSRKGGNLSSVFHRNKWNSLKYSNDQRGKLDWKRETKGLRAITAPSTNSQTNSHNFKTLNWIYL